MNRMMGNIVRLLMLMQSVTGTEMKIKQFLTIQIYMVRSMPRKPCSQPLREDTIYCLWDLRELERRCLYRVFRPLCPACLRMNSLSLPAFTA